MQKILVSGCLIGQLVRYDAGHCLVENGLMEKWQDEGRLVAVCPEVLGGLLVPREPAEMVAGSGEGVLRGDVRVQSRSGVDVTSEFKRGAERALEAAQAAGANVAILKAKSPSCGSERIYDGSFSKRLIPGMGVTAALLRQHGITVFNDTQLPQVEAWLAERD